MVERLRPVYEEWARGNWRAGVELFDPGMELRARVGEGLVISRGHQEVSAFLREFFSTFSDYSIEAEEFEERGQCVLVSGRQRGEGTASGMAVDVPVFQVWAFDGERVEWLLTTPHETEAREAAGL